MGFQVWNVPLQRRFIASTMSCGCCLLIMFWVFVAFVPLFLAYTSESFWLKQSSYREAPRARFTYQTLLVARGVDADGQALAMTFSTTPELRRGALLDTIRPASIRTWADDTNLDGAPEAVHVDVALPLREGESVHGLSAVLMFQMDFNTRVKTKLECAAYVDYSAGTAGGSFYADGDLVLVQRHALRVNSGYSKPYRTDPLLGNASWAPTSVEELRIPRVLARYRARNLTARFDNVMTSWTPYAGPTTVSGNARTTPPHKFTASFTVRFPEQQIIYVPTTSEMLKFAWMQYLSVAFIVYVLAAYSADFVFKYQIIETSSRLDTQYYGPKIHRF
jgi:transmembrane protein 231